MDMKAVLVLALVLVLAVIEEVVVEFMDDEIERLQSAIAKRLGYKLVDHRLELYGVPIEDEA
jgi:Fe2+ or Zn2+ uptake regulation protein